MQVYWGSQSTTTHTTDGSLASLEVALSNRIISRGLWQAGLPDLTLCNFYL
jgi:hypothetical protein